MSPDIAQALRGVARGRQSFVVLAVPRLAGKSTVLRAILAERPNAAAVMTLAEDGENVDELLKKSAGGYIVIPEITQSAAMPGYIWGAEVRRIFRAAKEGVSLAATLHGEGPDPALTQRRYSWRSERPTWRAMSRTVQRNSASSTTRVIRRSGSAPLRPRSINTRESSDIARSGPTDTSRSAAAAAAFPHRSARATVRSVSAIAASPRIARVDPGRSRTPLNAPGRASREASDRVRDRRR